METAQAIEVASSFAQQQGYETDQYTICANKRDDEWEVYFQRKSETRPSPGDFFTVYIDDQSRAVRRVIPGK